MKHTIAFLFLLFSLLSFSQNDSIISYGQNLIYENKLDDAISFYNSHLTEPQSPEQKIKLLIGLADTYKLKLDFKKTNAYLMEAYEEIERIEDLQLKFLYHVKMMEFYRKRGLYSEALDHQLKAEILKRNNPFADYYLSSYYGRKAALFSQHFGYLDSVVIYANKSLKLAEKVNHKDNIFYSKLELASVYERRGDVKGAITHFKDLLEYAKNNNLVQHQADVYINYTNALIKDNQLEKALQIGLEAIDFTKANDLLFNEIIVTINVYETYKKLGNNVKAYDYLLYRMVLTDAYNRKEHDKFLFELEEKYKLTEKENQIKISNLEIKNKNKELASNKINLYIILGLFLIAIVVTLMITYFLQKTKKSNRKLQLLSQENEFLLSEANHRINNNLQLVVILISDQLKKSSPDNAFQLKSILTKVDAISTLHKHLYKNRDKSKVDVANYLNDVKVSFFEVFKENDIQTDFKIDSVDISSDHAMYFGLLLSELCINSIKHAFDKEDSKTVNFRLTHKENRMYFNYSDTGSREKNKEVKPKLIDKICRQLKIEYQIETDNGFSFSFEKHITND
ncbi:histidine kinase dimerization/phosphoacceptor domain -containing protein [Bizionia sp.]|uniref:tetratricopeptide repeat-containing sensor histidine kinase n=1 Tax=Bizionia sp. TaxID=1954480 RepID=UPI003A903F59